MLMALCAHSEMCRRILHIASAYIKTPSSFTAWQTFHELAAPKTLGICFNPSVKLFSLPIKVESQSVSSGGFYNQHLRSN